MKDLKVGDRVRCGEPGALYGSYGVVVATPSWSDRTHIRWEGFVLSNGYSAGHPVLETLQSDPKR